MVVVDTLSWIEMLRPDGRKDVRERVNGHLRSGVGRLVPRLRLELWNGAKGERERKALREFETALPELGMDSAVWDKAYGLARKARSAGLTVPSTDLLIAACAWHHGAEIEACDTHFADLERLQGQAGCSWHP
jgi:predicted nucleic acid-binding protein